MCLSRIKNPPKRALSIPFKYEKYIKQLNIDRSRFTLFWDLKGSNTNVPRKECVFLIYIWFLMIANKPFLKHNHNTKSPAKTTIPIEKLRYFVEEPFVWS